MNPQIELLAIKFYEHSHPLGWYPQNAGGTKSWLALAEEDREQYRAMARGDLPLQILKTS